MIEGNPGSMIESMLNVETNAFVFQINELSFKIQHSYWANASTHIEPIPCQLRKF